MAFDWREYLQLSRFLEDGKTSYIREAALRCGVSRAYYAAFCHARNYARDNEGFVPKYDRRDHQLLRDHFITSREGMTLQLEQLRQWRNSCDYKDELRGLSGLIPSAIEYAQDIINELT